MIENNPFINISIYVILLVPAIFLIIMFIKDLKIRRKRQKEWDSIKAYFNCKDEISLQRLYTAYTSTIEKHRFLGYVYPDMGD